MAESTTKNGEEYAEIDPFEADLAWRSSAVAGFVAAITTGLLMSAIQPDMLRDVIAGLYGFEGNVAAGWAAHLVHGTLFGIAFAVVLTDPALARIGNRVSTTALAGTAYGLVLAVVGAGIIMPIWLGLIGFADTPPLPAITAPTILWHVVFGLVLGLVFFALYRNR